MKEDRRARFNAKKKRDKEWQPLYSVGDVVEVKGSIERPRSKTGTITRVENFLYFIREDKAEDSTGLVSLPYLEEQIIRKVER